MTAIVFAALLLVALVLCGAVAFSNQRFRPRLKWLLLSSLLLVWLSLGFSIAQIVARTSSTMVTPGGARQPHLLDSAAGEALTLLASLGGPAMLATILGVLALKISRRKPPAAPANRTP